MTLQEIIDEIYLLVKDDSFFTPEEGEEFPAALVRRVNEVVASACAQPGVEIPSLKKMGQFTTDPTEYFATVDGLSPNFAGKILAVGDPSKGIKIYAALEDLYADYYPLTEEGEIEGVYFAGNVVWYQKIPAVPTDVLCVIQDEPEMVSFGTDQIPVIPEFLQRQIVAHGVAALLYDFIEDGVDGNKNNTNNSKGEFLRGIQLWKEFLGARRQHNKTSHWRY
jgi:hypothetical protein